MTAAGRRFRTARRRRVDSRAIFTRRWLALPLHWRSAMRLVRMATAGFTLLELLVVLAIAGILLGIAAPRISAALPAVTLDQAARGLAGEMRLARSKAIARNTRVRIVADVASGVWRVETDSEGRFAEDGPPRPLPGGVAFDAHASSRMTRGSVSITFQPRGHTADNATIALASGDDLRRVVVNGAGRVRIDR